MKIARTVLTLLIVSLGCGPSDGSESEAFTPVGPVIPVTPVPVVPGSVAVTTTTSGADFDPDGYMLHVGGWWDYGVDPIRLATNGSVILRGLTPGTHMLHLYEVAANCRGENLMDRPALVVSNTVTVIKFDLECR